MVGHTRPPSLFKAQGNDVLAAAAAAAAVPLPVTPEADDRNFPQVTSNTPTTKKRKKRGGKSKSL